MEKLESQLKQITTGIPIEIVSQGAEAIVYKTNVHPYLDKTGQKVIIKYRPPKPYRHPVLDAQLTKHRTLSEARILQKLRTSSINVPKLVFIDARRGVLWMECVEGTSIKQWIWSNEDKGTDQFKEKLTLVGKMIGDLHQAGFVHGDLTSSNIMLNEQNEPVLIDFGLGSHSEMVEDKAVDLYVLERAVESTHPVNSFLYNLWLLEGYTSSYKKEKAKKEVMRRLEDVRMRGRKRSMVG